MFKHLKPVGKMFLSERDTKEERVVNKKVQRKSTLFLLHYATTAILCLLFLPTSCPIAALVENIS